MMALSDRHGKFSYTETDRFQAIVMPYRHDTGTPVSMLVILPKGNDLAAVEGSLNAQTLADVKKALSYRPVTVFFPKFRLETTYSLPDTLSSMGMPTAFSRDADFSGMDGAKDLFISDVIHKGFVDVNETGTEAAAATGVVVGAVSAPAREPEPIVFRADHPFIFLIQDDETGNILFMGRVVNPNG